ncbi:hypothetical protein [Paractinoplanes lichenicola]|uniref:Uncharacterized protein n=1 Tax=Paractinoplanes lichenicola TaxID=2802976 RepID=A0ABS1VUB2_9ACTN|nr:hypothetical protein [Actinoplanes lichenicola]MBL7258046.1 hypothetical protein [Actinoplanes lichenicola]
MADSGSSAEIRRLAAKGILAKEYDIAEPERRSYLWAGAAEIITPLLFRRVTRPLEQQRGHYRCASGLKGLAADCWSRFTDDLEAVVRHLLTRAVVPIENLEAWLTARLHAAMVDGYRRRRGERGAPQRPRVPGWLADELGHDGWLLELAVAIPEWAGNESTAGYSLWPLTSWSVRRAARTGDHTADEGVVAREVEVVLAAMRQRPTWYEKNVERPLGHKEAPVWTPSRSADGTHAEPEPVAVAAHEREDAELRGLAGRAVELIVLRLGRGEDPDHVVFEVLHTVFGGVSDEGGSGPERVLSLIDDPERFDLILARVMAVVTPQHG